MKFEKISIATARITGLKRQPYYFEHRCFYAWDIMFLDSSTLGFNNLSFIKVGDTEEEGRNFCNKVIENFKQVHIHDGDKVAVVFKENGSVIAIGCIGNDCWIDVRDNFRSKTFNELNVIATTLKVY